MLGRRLKPGGNEQNILPNICWVFCWDVFPHQKKIFYCFPTRGKLCWKMLGCDFPQLLVEGCSSMFLIRFKNIESTKIREDCWSAVSPPFCCFSFGETTTNSSFFMHNWLSLLFWELGQVQWISHLSPLFCSWVIFVFLSFPHLFCSGSTWEIADVNNVVVIVSPPHKNVFK